jgi:dienelactone hydrolase
VGGVHIDALAASTEGRYEGEMKRRSPLAVALMAGVTGGPLPYSDFPARHVTHLHRVSQDRIEVEIHDMLAAPAPLPLGLSGRELRGKIEEALNIGFLLDGIGSRRIVASVRDRHEHSRFTEEHIAIVDDALGSLQASVLAPSNGVDVHPAVVGLHGHGDHAADFIRRYMGAELARAGYVVIVPWSRAMDCGAEEEAVSLRLLRDGFTLMGLRVYEALLALRYLRQRVDVDPEHIALLGHSGGSSTANLVVRVTDWVSAYVSDHEVDYRDLCDGRVHCETVPALSKVAADVDDKGTLTIPFLQVPYGFADHDVHRRILDFLSQVLQQPPAQAR